MPSSTSKLLTRKKKTAQQFRRGSKTFRRNKKLRQNISAKKLYTKGKKFRRVARGFVNKLRSSIIHAKQSEETDIIKDILDKTIREIELEERERENEIRDTECPVCQAEMTEDEATELNCGHKFCNKCLITALQTDNLKCPLCRKPIGGEISRTLLTKSPQDMLIVAKEVLMEAEATAAAEEAMVEVRVQALRAATVSNKEAMIVFRAAPASSKMAAMAAADAASAAADAAVEAAVMAEERAAAARAAVEAAWVEATRAAERVAAAAREDELAARYEASRAAAASSSAASNHGTPTWQEVLSAANSSTRR